MKKSNFWNGVKMLKMIMFKCQNFVSGHEYFLQVERNGHELRINLDFKSVSLWVIYMTHLQQLRTLCSTWTRNDGQNPPTELIKSLVAFWKTRILYLPADWVGASSWLQYSFRLLLPLFICKQLISTHLFEYPKLGFVLM